MWTYRTAAAALSAHAVNAVKPASSSGAAKTIVKERSGQRGISRHLSAFYFAGMLFGEITFSRLTGAAGLFCNTKPLQSQRCIRQQEAFIQQSFLSCIRTDDQRRRFGAVRIWLPAHSFASDRQGCLVRLLYAWLYQTYRLKATALSAGLFLPTQCLMDVLMLKLCSFALRCSIGLLRYTRKTADSSSCNPHGLYGFIWC